MPVVLAARYAFHFSQNGVGQRIVSWGDTTLLSSPSPPERTTPAAVGERSRR